MALKEFQIVCSIIDIIATGNIIKFRVPFTGTLKQIDLWTNTANTSGDNVFNLNVAGSDLYSSGARPKIVQNATHGQKTGLSDALTFGDEIILQLESMATGGVGHDLVLQLVIEDGISPIEIGVACSDELTAITTGTAKLIFRAPCAFKLSEVRATLSTVSSSGNPEINIKKNGTTIFSTNLTIDSGEKTSKTAATAYALSSTPTTFADDDEIQIDIVTAGTGAKGLKVWFIGNRT